MSLPQHILQQIYQHYDAAELCIIVLDPHNQIKEFNSKAKEVLQIKQRQSIADVLPLFATESLDESFFLPFYNHENWVFDVHFFSELTCKYVVLVPAAHFHKQVLYKQQLAHDEEIEKQKFKTLFKALESAQHELIAANKSKSFYISALSHEMGNPLNAIQGYNQLLQEGEISMEQATSIIEKNVKKLHGIITQAIDYDNKTTQVKKHQFKPHELIDDLLKDFKIQADQKSLKLINQVSKHLLVTSNRTKWQQIFTNLISNAIKYTQLGSVHIQSIQADNKLIIDVIDTGCGISQKFQQQLFSAWSREYKSEVQGNGIGLAISRMLAEQLNAKLLLFNSDDHGSTFRFEFPLEEQRSLKILLVDDDADCLDLFAFYLSKDHHQVTTASSLDALIKHLNLQYFDLIVTDLNLAHRPVTDVIELIKSKVPKKIVMTANPSETTRHKLLDIGFDEVLAKPLNESNLRNNVTKLSQTN